MENAGYTTLSRMTGLTREMNIVANNIANTSTMGYRQAGLVFAEHVEKTGEEAFLSMPTGKVRNTSLSQGGLTQTGGTLDFAVEGEGFFMVETSAGQRLTRAGSFSQSADGELVTSQGFRVLDASRAPIFVPPGAAGVIVSSDGSISQGGQPLAQIGLFSPASRNDLIREDGVSFRTEGNIDPVPEPRILQGFLEGANVDPVGQLARMVEVQRAYEMGQSFLDSENERIRSAIETLTR